MSFTLDPARTAVLVIGLQNDNVADDGASGGTAALVHAREVGVVANAARIADAARQTGVPVIHVHFVVDPETGGAGTNIPLFEAITTHRTVERDTYGAAPVTGAEPVTGDLRVERSRMSAFHDTALDTILRCAGKTHLVLTGVHTNHAVGTTARDAADLGYTPLVVSDATASTTADAHAADLLYGFADIAPVIETNAVLAALDQGDLKEEAR
ncbi:cysteine hydrolase [Microbacterium saperdae]|uniref:Nicotinamidase-related amidase n=1 Tax=Microbacterium saperdae TaxID=69368 RepID=A0A543BLB5_9MICO|nr:cysteine hydrolase [Microbacterium saperdae]TQL85612.1 nicotinamidase-related amidase [Microbacterium saperdae]GGM62251.1 isochorismatase [Microbacterium saperdae]